MACPFNFLHVFSLICVIDRVIIRRVRSYVCYALCSVISYVCYTLCNVMPYVCYVMLGPYVCYVMFESLSKKCIRLVNAMPYVMFESLSKKCIVCVIEF
jgi:hypothetical protein